MEIPALLVLALCILSVACAYDASAETARTTDLMRRVECDQRGCTAQQRRSSRRRTSSFNAEVGPRGPQDLTTSIESVGTSAEADPIVQDSVVDATSSEVVGKAFSDLNPDNLIAEWILDVFGIRHLSLEYEYANEGWWGKLVRKASFAVAIPHGQPKQTPKTVKSAQLVTAGIMTTLVVVSSLFAYGWVYIAERRYGLQLREAERARSEAEKDDHAAQADGSSSSDLAGETGGSSSALAGETGGSESPRLNLPDDGGWWRWRAGTLGSLVCMNLYTVTYAIVAVQKPLQKYMGMNLINYNLLIGLRFFPAMFASISVPHLQARFGSGRAVLYAAFACIFSAAMQMIAMITASYYCLLLSNIGLEVCLGMVTSIIPAVTARVMHGNEQSLSLTQLHLLGTVGMMTPLVILPAMLDHLALPTVICIISVASAINNLGASYCYWWSVNGRLPPETVEQVFSSSGSSVSGDSRLLGLLAVIVLVGTVSVTCRENVGGKLQETFDLTVDEVGMVQFVGIFLALLANVTSLITDKYGQRPYMMIFGHVLMLMGLECIRSKLSAMGACTLFGTGFGVCFNAGYSVISLLVPGPMINQVLAIVATGSYLSFTILPVAYGYLEMYYKKGVVLLQALTWISLVCMVFVSWIDMKHHGGPMYGIKKYDERMEDGENEQQQALLQQGSHESSSSS